MSWIRTIGAIAALALAFALSAAAASAKTVYDYTYSGTYIDGSGAGKTFDENVSGLAYDSTDGVFYVANGGKTGWIEKLTSSGAGVDIGSSGSPLLTFYQGGPEYYEVAQDPQVSVDTFGGPGDGNFYVLAGAYGAYHGYTPDGTPLPDLHPNETELCGVMPQPPNGDELLVPARNGMAHYRWSDGLRTAEDFSGAPGYEPGVKVRWDERGKVCRPVIDSAGEVYGQKYTFFGGGPIVKMDLHGLERYEVTRSGTGVAVAVDPSDDQLFVINTDGTIESYDSEGRRLGGGWGKPDAGLSYPGLAPGTLGMAVDPATHDLWVANRHSYGGVARIEKFVRTNPHVIPDTTAISPDYSDPAGETVVLRGTLNSDGVDTTSCYFEYGTTQTLGTVAPCSQGNVFGGSSDQQVTTAPIPFTKGQRYWYRLFAKNGNGQIAESNSTYFLPQGLPKLKLSTVDRINTDGARFRTEFDPNGGNASVHYIYGVKGGPLDQQSSETDTFGFRSQAGQFSGENVYLPGIKQTAQLVAGLQPDTTYEYRAVVTNEAGSVLGDAGEFTTYRKDPGNDPCPNALARQQSGSSLLLDCRGYELVSAHNAGGFDVEAEGIPGQMPLQAYPWAEGRLLYSLHHGVIPGVAGHPTNYGLDPYVAVRGANGWTTEYVGLPSTEMADDGAFGSPLYGADPSLREFAFGGPSICDPCFSDGTVNVPLRGTDGSLTKGMQGSLDPSGAEAPSGVVREAFSADGTHFVFGSDAPYETAGGPSGSIYDRDLTNNSTQVVSTLPDGSAIAGGEVAELGISHDGSRVVVGKQLDADAKGNPYYHLYMHVGSTAASVDLTPGASAGVLYDGMSEDGSRVFMTTTDQLLPTDTDESADIYEAAVAPAAADAALRLVSTRGGTASNDDACTPSGDWNSPSGAGKCDALAFAGGAGVARGNGAFFFLSPEQLEGTEGMAGEPNLYFVAPDGAPRFVATIDEAPIDNQAIAHATDAAEVRTFADIQVAPSGRYAVFVSALPLTGYPNFGNQEIYRFDAENAGAPLACASCSPTGGAATYGARLNVAGLNLTDDGRVFFTTRESLALRDTNLLDDAYEWSGGQTQLISTGIGSSNSGLVTVSADGHDAFFFTRDVLVPEDENGKAVKIYDAREGGGSVYDPPRKLCAASDECHGAGSPQPGPPAINTVTGAGPEAAAPAPKRCKKGFVRRHGKCVKKHRKHRHVHRKGGHRHG